MTRALLAAALFTVATGAGAQQADGKRQPLWEVGVVGGVASMPAYPGSSDRSTRALALPFLIYRGEVFRSDQSGIGARLLHTDVAEFDIGFAASLPARSQDVAARAGMPDLGTLVEFGPRLKVRLGNPTPASRVRLDLPVRAVIELRGGLRRQGLASEPKLVFETRDPNGVWSMDAHVGVVFGDRKVNNYFYEVQPQFVRADRPEFHASRGMMLARAGVSGTYKINPELLVFGFLRYDSYAHAANRDSPLMKETTGTSAGIGFAWTLTRSAALAKD